MSSSRTATPTQENPGDFPSPPPSTEPPVHEPSFVGPGAQEEPRPGVKDPAAGDPHRDALGMAPDSGRLPPPAHPRRPHPPQSSSQRSQRPPHSDPTHVGVVGPPPPFGQHAYAPASGAPYNQGATFANQYALAQQSQLPQQSMSLVHSPPTPFFPGYAIPPDNALMPQNIHGNYPMMQHHGSVYGYQRQSPPEGSPGSHTQYSGAGPSQVYSPQVNPSPPPLSPSHSGSPTYSGSGQFQSLRYSTLPSAQYGYHAPPSFSASPPLYQSPPFNPGYPTYASPGDSDGSQGTWWFMPHAASPYETSQPTYPYTMGYPASMPPPDSDTPPYTQRHTPAPILASPAPSPHPAVPPASSVRPPAVPGSVSAPLALSPPSSQQSPRPDSNSGSSYRAGGSDRTPVRRPYHPNPPAHRSEWVMWVGNVPSDATHEELYRFFNVPYLPGDDTTGVLSIFPISRSNCAFVNYSGQGPLEEAIKRFNGKQLRPNDPRCPGFVCRVRKVDDDLKAGVGAQRGMGIHSKWIRDQKNKLKAGPPSITSAASAASEDAPPTTPSSASGDVVAGMSNLSMSSDEHSTTTGLKSNSSGSYASTNSSLLASHFPKRYFILKSLTQFDLDLSVEKGVWATQKHNEGILDQAYRTSKEVYLIFGVNKSGEFYGYARMSGPVKGERKVSWASRAGDFSPSVSPTTGRHNSITAEEGIASTAAKSPITNFLSPASGRLVDNSPLPLGGESSRPTTVQHPKPAKSAPAEFGVRSQLSISMHPVGRHTHEDQPSPEFALDETAPIKAQRNAPASAATTDSSGRAPGERDRPEPARPSLPSRNDSGREETWGESFSVEWLCTKRLPFFRTRHLRNPWNHDREVKVSRDGTELEPAVGQRLLDEWEKLATDAELSPGAETPAAKDAPSPAPPKRTTSAAREPRRRDGGGS
ncbi:YT521-B-like domain-containing protein [Schizophyllum fasciatum]